MHRSLLYAMRDCILRSLLPEVTLSCRCGLMSCGSPQAVATVSVRKERRRQASGDNKDARGTIHAHLWSYFNSDPYTTIILHRSKQDAVRPPSRSF